MRESKILVHSSMVQFLVGIRTPPPPLPGSVGGSGFKGQKCVYGGVDGYEGRVCVGRSVDCIESG